MIQLPTPMNNESGTALILVLGILAVLTILTISLADRTSQSLHVVRLTQSRSMSLIEARRILMYSMPAVDFRRGLLSGIENGSPCETEFDFVAGSSPRTFNILDAAGDTIGQIQSRDEMRAINVNYVSVDILSRIPHVTPSIADAIIDWRDTDNTTRADGAESDYYEALDIPYSAKNGLFESKEELLLVKGMSPPLYRKIEPYVTVYGRGTVNLNTCSGQILATLGLDEDCADRIIRIRDGIDGVNGTDDDMTFFHTDSVVLQIQREGVFDGAELDKIQALFTDDLLGVTSDHCNIEVTTGSLNAREGVTVNAILHRTPKGAIQPIYWRQL